MNIRFTSSELSPACVAQQPAANEPSAPQQAPRAPGVNVTSGNRILLVEDDETLALLITYNLQVKGYSVSWLARGDVVDAFLSRAAVDLLVLDWMLPGRSGLDICRSLRGRPDMRSIPIIMVTALEDEGDRVAGLSAGADAYFAKPFLMTELLARVDSLLSPPLGSSA